MSVHLLKINMLKNRRTREPVSYSMDVIPIFSTMCLKDLMLLVVGQKELVSQGLYYFLANPTTMCPIKQFSELPEQPSYIIAYH